MSASKFSINGVNDKVLQSALADLADESYTFEKKFTSTGVVSGNDTINTGTETYTGQLRWEQPLKANINVGDIASSAKGTLTHGSQEMLTYVKTTRAAGSDRKNLERVLTQKDGLAKFARDQVEIRGQDEHSSILSVLRGVAISEIITGTAGKGGQTFSNDPEDPDFGFYVDLATADMISAASSSNQGAQRANSLIRALGMGFKDYEPEYVYLFANPQLLAQLRAANLIDKDRIQDGNMELETIFQGKFRLIKSRANMQITSADMAYVNKYVAEDVGNSVDESGTNLVGTKMSFLALPGSVAFESLIMDEPVGTESSASANKGFGTSQLWFRWGYVAHPAGYSWDGPDDAFVPINGYDNIISDEGYMSVADVRAGKDGATEVVKGVWKRKASSVLNLGILPILHSGA